jgi:hypothetical protein
MTPRQDRSRACFRCPQHGRSPNLASPRSSARRIMLVCRRFRSACGPQFCATKRTSVPAWTTQSLYLQAFHKSGSDRTRTRDLRRDRPTPGRQRQATIPQEQPHLQAFSYRHHFRSAWLSQSSCRCLGHDRATKAVTTVDGAWSLSAIRNVDRRAPRARGGGRRPTH